MIITPETKRTNLDDKDYIRPDPDSSIRDWRVDKIDPNCPDLDAIEEYSDFIFAADAVTFILGRNRDAGIYDPNSWSIPVGNYKRFTRGDRIMIDTMDGKAAVRTIRMMDGRTIVLHTPLTHLPKVGGEVIKLLGVSNDAINKRKSEQMAKEEKKLYGGRWL